MVVNLHKIQPGEDTLCKESVEHFLQNRDRLFVEIPRILIYICNNQPFKYYAIDGNSRLFVCYKLGIMDIPIEPEIPDCEELYLPTALEVYSQVIRRWADLEKRIITELERDRLQYV